MVKWRRGGGEVKELVDGSLLEGTYVLSNVSRKTRHVKDYEHSSHPVLNNMPKTPTCFEQYMPLTGGQLSIPIPP